MLKLLAVFTAAWIFKFVLQKYMALRSVASSCLGICPGGTILWLEPLSPASIVIGSVFPPKGWIGNWFSRFSLYMKHQSTCVSSVLYWNAVPVFWVSNSRAIKNVLASRGTFTKDAEAYSMINVWDSRNVISTEGAEWKRHRSVANPAFNEANNALVWQVTSGVLKEWFSKIDRELKFSNDLTINVLDDMNKVALLIISRAGFGRHASWEDSNDKLSGHDRTFQNAVWSAADHLPARVLVPDWMHRLSEVVHIPFISEYLKESRNGFDTVKMHLLEVIALARDCIASGKKATIGAALLQNLVEANMSQDSEGMVKHLSDAELLSNSFAFFMAGHETTSHAVCFAILFLAVYPNIQQRAYQEVHQLWPDDNPFSEPSLSFKESLARLAYISAIFHETLRLFPPVQRLPRRITIDTSLTACRFSATPDGKISGVEEYEVPVKAGGMVYVDFLGMHMNPLHWGDDVAEFKPERFIDTDTYRWPRDAFMPFSSGPRSCIGQRFALTESICILAQVVRKYEICVPEEIRGWPLGEQRDFMLKWAPRVTMTPLNSKALFRSRK